MKSPTPLVALRMPQELLDEIDRRARTRFVSRSDAIRSLLWKQIEKEDRTTARTEARQDAMEVAP
jgi:Arc/MetJ-type ribon-helix-helix transcriptional regulator